MTPERRAGRRDETATRPVPAATYRAAGVRNPELLAVARRCLDQLAQVAPEHRVLVLTDEPTRLIGAVFARAAEDLALVVRLLEIPVTAKHGAEPPEQAAAAMLGADVVVQAVKHALTHTDATRAAMARGAQVLVLRGMTEGIMLSDIMDVDYVALRRVTGAVADRLTNAGSVYLTSPAGTDLRFSIAGRTATALAGGTAPGRFGGPRSGEAAIAPLEGSAEGVAVIEHSMDNLGLLEEPVRLTFRGGRLASVDGGVAAGRLLALLEASDENAANLAEFAIGTNPNARLTGNLATDKKVKGSVHLALGDSLSLGGTVRSDLHVDGMVLSPTVLVDGWPLVVAGALSREVDEPDACSQVVAGGPAHE
jgi:leucyl aminopeptidase (aminopeptidase T)